MDKAIFPTENCIQQQVERALDFHCHGVGRFDFTEIPELDLEEIEELLSKRKQRTILTLYLPKPNFEQFLYLMQNFYEKKKAGKFSHIVGFGLEGPLLASHGGTPETGIWMPSKQHWRELAACGQKGLVYVVLSPDAHLGKNAAHTNPHSISWIAETLLDGGVLPAPGHFIKSNPSESAKALQTIFDIVASWGYCPTISDHLFNDMPRNFKHAWRTPAERKIRDQEIKMLKMDSWDLDTLEENLGPVPAVMIKNARRGHVKICLNFDGEHVDLAVAKKAVELIGAENMLMMTDSIESKRLAGRHLQMQENSTLLYQDEGIVAAGSQNVFHQVKNMFSIGLTEKQISLICDLVPSSIIKQRYQYAQEHAHVKADCV